MADVGIYPYIGNPDEATGETPDASPVVDAAIMPCEPIVSLCVSLNGQEWRFVIPLVLVINPPQGE